MRSSASPSSACFAIGIAGCALGIARAAIDDVLDLAGTRMPFGLPATLATRTTAKLAVCEAIALVRSARALLREETTMLWHQVRSGTLASAQQRASLRLAATHATAASARAVDLMYTAAGSTSVFASSPLQQRLRDIRAATQHFFVAPRTYETIGKVVLGVETRRLHALTSATGFRIVGALAGPRPPPPATTLTTRTATP